MLALTPTIALAFTLPSFTPTTSHTAAVARHASVACSLSRRDAALCGSGAALFGVMGGIPAPAYAAEIKKVVVAGATGQTGRRALSLLAKTSGVSVVGGVRDTAKAAKKLSESKIEIRGAMIEKGAAIDASAVELAALDVEKNSVSEMSATLKGADGLVIAVGFVPGEQQQHTSHPSIHPTTHSHLSSLFARQPVQDGRLGKGRRQCRHRCINRRGQSGWRQEGRPCVIDPHRRGIVGPARVGRL